MADESIPKQKFTIKDLKTRSVTLYPAKAHVIRTLDSVSLQPGQNQIVIVGLTPTVDEHSIRVDGTGTATITDLSVESIENPEKFEDLFPPEEESEEKSDDEAESRPDEESDDIKRVNAKIKELDSQLQYQTEMINSATVRLAILEKYGDLSTHKDKPTDMGKFLEDYKSARAVIFEDHKKATDKSNSLKQQIQDARKQKHDLGKGAAKALQKAQAEAQKKMQAKIKANAEKAKKAQELRHERSRFWPRKVFKITVSIETPAGFTPMSSRRNSTESLVTLSHDDIGKAVDAQATSEVNLSVSYVTSSAGWSPRYDLSLNSVTSTGLLEYGASLTNTTCETWQDAKVILSTSQTTYQGLGNAIPVLQKWTVRLSKNGKQDSALYSTAEQSYKRSHASESVSHAKVNRAELFGAPNTGAWQHANSLQYSAAQAPASHGRRALMVGGFGQPQMQQQATHPQFQQQMAQMAPQQQNSLFGTQSQLTDDQRRSAPAGALFGARSAAAPPPPGRFHYEDGASSNLAAPATDSYGLGSAAVPFGFGNTNSRPSGSYEAELADEDDTNTLTPVDPALLFEESTFEESGLTTTYDLPGLKTLAPTSIASKHRIAKIEFKAVVFNHTLVPKLQAAAFLKCRLRNLSKITLLKGVGGLTLDGSFLGQSIIPRCSSGDNFTLPLGIDPAINVSYAKPTVHRSQTGIFNKEACEVYTRTAIITNTKSNAIVELSVIDQVPVSEDERLRIEIVSPRGLRINGDSVQAGVPTISDATAAKNKAIASAANNARMSVYGDDGKKSDGAGKDGGKWGSAVAVAKTGGEVTWNVKIQPGRGCKLVLEYEATYPNGETVVGG